MARKPEDREMSVLERIKALDEERSALLETAKGDAYERAQRAVEELRELGFKFSLVEDDAPAEPRRSARKAAGEAPKRTPRTEICPICEFKTNPIHDRRAHRSQQPKRPFTD